MSNAFITTMLWIFNVPQRFIYLVPRVILSPVWWYWKLWDSRKPGFSGFFRVPVLVLVQCILYPKKLSPPLSCVHWPRGDGYAPPHAPPHAPIMSSTPMQVQATKSTTRTFQLWALMNLLSL